MKAMLASNLPPDLPPLLAENGHDEMSLKNYIENVAWVLEPKHDGIRTLVHVDPNGVTWRNRNDEPLTKPIPPELHTAFKDLPGSMVLDGELVGDRFWAFDLPVFGKDLTLAKFQDRRDLLVQVIALINHPSILCTELAEGWLAKERMWNRALTHNWEGVVIKHQSGIYEAGRRSHFMVKAKITHTVDAFIGQAGVDGKENATLLVLDERGDEVEIGKCSLNGKPDVRPGDVVEVRYLNAEKGRLVQPRMVRVREDKTRDECLHHQLLR